MSSEKSDESLCGIKVEPLKLIGTQRSPFTHRKDRPKIKKEISKISEKQDSIKEKIKNKKDKTVE